MNDGERVSLSYLFSDSFRGLAAAEKWLKQTWNAGGLQVAAA